MRCNQKTGLQEKRRARSVAGSESLESGLSSPGNISHGFPLTECAGLQFLLIFLKIIQLLTIILDDLHGINQQCSKEQENNKNYLNRSKLWE
ncbi:hypothetical protein B9Z55_002827 [Caenorhabditis nigoni]|uniref:Uncharacterized protein n=1 Tax=Caenorhabditis nigoni TaxID=1611254 RepID=A0A2G5VMN4_9PELO|nr:hypothetical protein B9Z55_002827 [Caenorhabditis nigoni]